MLAQAAFELIGGAGAVRAVLRVIWFCVGLGAALCAAGFVVAVARDEREGK